jgi:hypothetical protein
LDEGRDWGESLVSAYLYLEGGGDNHHIRKECRQGFARLLEDCGFGGRMPRLIAAGGRTAAFDAFKTRLEHSAPGDFVGLLVDSEEPLAELNATWKHLRKRRGDEWKKPGKATDEQVFFMTTCMETWIVGDRETLKSHYGLQLKENALPPLGKLESRDRHAVQDALAMATANCTNSYEKGTRSYQILGKLRATTLKQHLPSFKRMAEILERRL